MVIVKKVNIKNCPYYFFKDMININNFDTNLLSIGKTSFKCFDAITFHIKYIAIKS